MSARNQSSYDKRNINKQYSTSSNTSNNSLDSPTVFTAKLPGLNATITASSHVDNNSHSTHNNNNSSTKMTQQQQQQKRHSEIEKRERRLDEITSNRDDLIAQRQRAANEQKARTLAMYDSMAKAGNAGESRTYDLKAYTGKESSGKLLVSGGALQKRDLVEETIRARAKACDDNKKRLLAAFDYAAKTQPSGTVRDVNIAAFKGTDVSDFEIEKPCGACTFQMSGGVPKVVRASPSAPSTPVVDPNNKQPSFARQPSEDNMDAYERSLRARKQQADERKRRTLAAYKAIAASGEAGPKLVVQEELEHFEIPDELPKPKFSCTTSFSGGAARI